MTRGELREGALWYAGQYSTNRFDAGDWMKLNPLVNVRLRRFTRESCCLFADDVALTLTIGTAEYNLSSTSIVAKRVCLPVDVVVNSRPLVRFDGTRGPVSFHQLVETYPDWLSRADEEPRHWYQKSADVIQLFPPPVSAYTGLNFVAGYVEHADVAVGADFDASSTADTTAIVVPSDMEEECKMFVALGLIHPVKEKEAYAALLALCKPKMDESLKRARRTLASGTIVGGKNSSLERDLGY